MKKLFHFHGWLNFLSYDGVDVVRVSKNLRRSEEHDACSGLHPGLHGASYSHIVSELVQNHKIQQMILDQSSPASLPSFSVESPSAQLG